MWNHLRLEELHRMPRDPDCSACRNVFDLQRIAAIKRLDRQIAQDHANGYGVDVDAALDRRAALVEYLRSGPHS